MPLDCIEDVRTTLADVAKMSLLSSSIGGVRYHADEDADHNMLQGKSRFYSSIFSRPPGALFSSLP